jgi:hypothetical protein
MYISLKPELFLFPNDFVTSQTRIDVSAHVTEQVLTVRYPAVVARVTVANVHLARSEAFTGTARHSTPDGLQHNQYLILF